jgi:uncharacterized protein
MYCIISNDHLKVYFANKPLLNHEVFELNIEHGLKHVYDSLKKLGIIHGLLKEVIENIVDNKVITAEKVTVAKGTEPLHEGIELNFNFDHTRMPDLENTQNADFHNLGYGIDVFEGQLLAEQINHGPGVSGTSVYGKKIPYKQSTLKPLSYNGNVIIEKSGPSTRFFSKIDGVLLNNKKDALYIEEQLIINNHVDYNIGNLSCSHSIYIHGDLKPGFFVRSKKDITIKGSVDKGAIVQAEGFVSIGRGVNQDANIYSGKNLDLKFSQSATLKSDSDIYISGHCFDSHVFCKGTFKCDNNLVKGEKGAVIGGTINALKEIELSSVGSSNAITHLITGYDHDKKREHDKLKHLSVEINHELKRLVRSLSFNILGKLPPEEQLKNLKKEEKIANLKILRQISQLKKQEIHVGTQKTALSQKKETLFSDATITVHNSTFPDVKLDINNCFLDIYDISSGFIAQEKNGKILLK